MAVTARVEVLPESEPVSNLLLRHATVSGAARAPVGRADPKDGESWNRGNRSRRPCIALSRFCYRRRKTLALQGPRKLPKLAVAGSTLVARSRRNPVEEKGFLHLRRQRVVSRIREGYR